MKGFIISGFPGVGKTTVHKYLELDAMDSDSSKFDKAHFPQNYIEHIRKHYDEGKLLMVSSHKAVREALVEAGLPFVLVYPARECKEAYMRRYIERGSPDTFVQLLDSQWDQWITECEKFEGNEYVLRGSQDFLGDKIHEIMELYKDAA